MKHCKKERGVLGRERTYGGINIGMEIVGHQMSAVLGFCLAVLTSRSRLVHAG
jgi:hypothetical protein